MTKILLLSGFLLALKILPAQTNKFSLAVGAGGNQPIGAFGKKDMAQTNAAFAQTGASANFTATYMLTKMFGFTALLGAQDNSTDTKQVAGQIKQQTFSPANTTAGVTLKHWQMGKLLVGGNMALPLNTVGNLLFTTRLLAGVLKTNLPKQSGVITGKNYDGNIFSEYIQRNAISLPFTFTAMAGTGVQYNFCKKAFLIINVDYNYAAPKSQYSCFDNFANTPGYINTVPTPGSYLYNQRQGMCNVSLTTGVGIKL